jgi:hypothetical protein
VPNWSASSSWRKAQAYAAAQDQGALAADLDPAHLAFLIIALNAWWFSAPQLARMLTSADDHDPAEHARRRATVVRAARRLALPLDLFIERSVVRRSPGRDQASSAPETP